MRNFFLMLLAFAFALLAWYLLFRPFEYQVNFQSRTLPGDIIETIRIWNRTFGGEIVEVDSTMRVVQDVNKGGRNYRYVWNFELVNDSTTAVNIQISEPSRSMVNKFMIPFSNTAIEQDAREISSEFYNILKQHLAITSVKIVGEEKLDAKFCVCTTRETSQIEKANGMMVDYPLLTAIVDDFDLEVAGPPIVKVRYWSHNEGKLKFDFCFPIQPTMNIPELAIPHVEFKQVEAQIALKAEYRGNYITSDRAWYSLIQYAAANGYKINGLPVELFHDNPNLGWNEKDWLAEVFLPIASED